VIADSMRGAGRYNLAQGAVATAELANVAAAGSTATAGTIRNAGSISPSGFVLGRYRRSGREKPSGIAQARRGCFPGGTSL
jgi:hypothetical protein